MLKSEVPMVKLEMIRLEANASSICLLLTLITVRIIIRMLWQAIMLIILEQSVSIIKNGI